MEHHVSSGELNLPYVCKYTNISLVKNKKQITGYKLVMDMVENYYSVGTGMYRYKTGRVRRRNTDYANLYRGTEYYCEEMNNKTAIFSSVEDLRKFYPDSEDDPKVGIVKFTITGEMIEATASNKYHTCKVFAGDTIKEIKRI